MTRPLQRHAALKGFLEQLLRPQFVGAPGRKPRNLAGKSARVVVTMGMPALVYRWYFRAHGLKNLERSILRFCGFGPVRSSLVGEVEKLDPRGREGWLGRMRLLGERAL